MIRRPPRSTRTDTLFPYTTLFRSMAKLFEEMATDPGHPVRARAEQMLASLAADLQTDPAARARVERVKSELIDNPAVGQWLDGQWATARAGLLKAAHEIGRAHI